MRKRSTLLRPKLDWFSSGDDLNEGHQRIGCDALTILQTKIAPMVKQ
jgi:hypothetical protein